MQFLSYLALAAPIVSAIQFTSPTINSTLVKGAEYDVTWSTVDTDPTAFSIYLVNFVNWPPFYQQVAADVDTSLGEYSITVPCGVDTSYGFQLNAINGTNVYVIYAQTGKFSVAPGSAPCVDTSSTATVCAAASTVTVLVPQTGYANGTAVVTAAPQPTKNVGRDVSATCPETIGWGSSGYSSPVTLTSVPHPPTATPTKA
ncbi:Ser-Thr-rich glycosyl-phosphatidyl-inositol-anchored membrane family-domain-containing protein, partial [Pseudomassariella vexata]